VNRSYHRYLPYLRYGADSLGRGHIRPVHICCCSSIPCPSSYAESERCRCIVRGVDRSGQHSGGLSSNPCT